MPSLEDIEKFKSAVNALGHEPSILADRGEKLEDVSPPEGISDDLSELLSDTSDLTPVDGSEQIDELDFDEDADLFEPDDLSESFEDEEDQNAEEDEIDGPPGFGGFSFEDDFFNENQENEDTEASFDDALGMSEDLETEETELDEIVDDIEVAEDTGTDTVPEDDIFTDDIADDIFSDFTDESSAAEDVPEIEETQDIEQDFFDISETDASQDLDADGPGIDDFGLEDLGDTGGEIPDDFQAIDEESVEEAEEVTGEVPEDLEDIEEPVAVDEEEFSLPGEDDSLFRDIAESEAIANEIFGDELEDEPSDEDSFMPIGDDTSSPEEEQDDFAVPEDLLGGLEEDLSAEPEEDEEDIADAFSLPEDMPEDITGEISTDMFTDEEQTSLPDEFSVPDDISGESFEEPVVLDESVETDEGFSVPMDDLEEPSIPEDLASREESAEDFADSFELPPDIEEPSTPEREEIPDVPIEPEEFSLFDEGEDDSLPEFGMPEGFPFQDEQEETPSEEPSEEPAQDFKLDEGMGEGLGDGIGEDADIEAGFPLSDEFEIPTADDIDSLSEENFEVDEFNLGDLGAQFGEFEESGQDISVDTEEASVLPVGGELAASEDDLEISDSDFEAMTETLSKLPLNLKIIIEELIGEKDLSGEPLKNLINKLIEGASAKELAQIAGKITGKKIKIPSGYEKSTGEAFVHEKGTLGYTLRYNVLPILRITAAAIFIIALTGFLGYNFMYRPLHALSLYNKGYDELESSRFGQSESYFKEALAEWRYKDQFFRYAHGYQEKNQFNLASTKYEDLLKQYPYDKNAIFEYGTMESTRLENHVKAEEIFDLYLSEIDKHDYKVLLAAGDNYLAWGAYDSSKYDNAGYSYKVLTQHYGNKLELLFRMMKLYIRTDKYNAVMDLKKQFDVINNFEPDPFVYTELAGYLIDKDKLGDVRKILFKTLEEKDDIAETHYQLGRYFRKVEEPEEERKALGHSLTLYGLKSPLLRKDMAQYIDAENRYGEVLFDSREFLDAEQHFLKARQRYETAAARRMVEPDPQFGRIYKNLGDLNYYVSGDLDAAYELYVQGEGLGYTNADVSYKKGYITYHSGDFKNALDNFYEAEDSLLPNTNLMYTMGNCFFQRRDFHSAGGYYSRLLTDLEQERDSALILEPEEREDHAALLENIMRVHNNLGVVFNRLSQSNNDKDKFDASLVEFTKSMELFDLLTRDPDTDARREVKNLSYINQRAVLFPMGDYDLQIYPDIPLDMETLFYR